MEWSPIRFVIIFVIKQIGIPLRGRPILLINRMITNRIGLHSVLLPLLIVLYEGTSSQLHTQLTQLRKESLKKNSGLYEISFRNYKSCVYNCDDLPSNNSSLRSSHIWFSCIHNFNNYSDKTAAGLTQSVESVTAERKVADSIPGAGPSTQGLKTTS